ncbi:MAG: metalloregulator ArsR/SmtB family transcription factor [Actinomycetaceae bacterium]|nr:metalloregulator ArsR/SmtB family transcription factor [Actinomycetaceae bacterium]
MSYSPEDFLSVVDLFKALGSDKRIEILRLLFESPRCVHELCSEINISQPLTSQHLRVLREAHIIRVERKGRENVYHMSNTFVRQLILDAIEHRKAQKAVLD